MNYNLFFFLYCNSTFRTKYNYIKYNQVLIRQVENTSKESYKYTDRGIEANLVAKQLLIHQGAVHNLGHPCSLLKYSQREFNPFTANTNTHGCSPRKHQGSLLK